MNEDEIVDTILGMGFFVSLPSRDFVRVTGQRRDGSLFEARPENMSEIIRPLLHAYLMWAVETARPEGSSHDGCISMRWDHSCTQRELLADREVDEFATRLLGLTKNV